MAEKPNIIIITCDQLTAFATGCYGNEQVKTPNIDRLANSGVRFVNGISNAPVCMAARSIILSGQHNRSCTGGISNVGYVGGKEGSYPMPEYPAPGRLHFPEQTLPEVLKENGYHTTAIGKWHIYTWPDVIGFDDYIIPRTHHVNSTQNFIENGGEEFVPEGWAIEYETQRACNVIQNAKKDNPYFLYLNYSPPHPPILDCPEEYLQMYNPDELNLRENIDESGEGLAEHHVRVYNWDYRYYELQLPYTLQPIDLSLKKITSAYYGNVTWLDYHLGKVLDTVEESGQKDNTIIVFTADHGDNLGSHGRNGKGLPYEEALRIPMIYSYPEKLTSKVDGECIASLLDIAPTLLSNSGIEIPSHMAGKDVLHENLNHTICEIIPGNFLLRTDRFTIQASKSKNEDNLICRAFFDNQNDPYQMTNYNESEKFSNEINEGLSTLEAFHKNVSIMPKPDYRFKKP